MPIIPPGVRAVVSRHPQGVPPSYYPDESGVLPPTYDGRPGIERTSEECGRNAAIFADNADQLATRMENYRGVRNKRMFRALAVHLRQLSAALRLAGADFDPRKAGDLMSARTCIAGAQDLLGEVGQSTLFWPMGVTRRFEELRDNLAQVTTSLRAATLSQLAREEHERIESESHQEREAAGVETVREQLAEQERKQEEIIAGLATLAEHVASLRDQNADRETAVSHADADADASAPPPALSDAQKEEMDGLFRGWFERSRQAAECDADQLKAALREAQRQLPVDLDAIVGALGDELREEIAAALAVSQESLVPSLPALPAISNEQAR